MLDVTLSFHHLVLSEASKLILNITKIMRSFSFVCEELRSLCCKIKITLKKLCRPVLINCRDPSNKRRERRKRISKIL